jgi:hypothetical protein
MAYSRHGDFTGQSAQMRRAISTPTPSLGKNLSGGSSLHFPRDIHELSIADNCYRSVALNQRESATFYLQICCEYWRLPAGDRPGRAPKPESRIAQTADKSPLGTEFSQVARKNSPDWSAISTALGLDQPRPEQLGPRNLGPSSFGPSSSESTPLWVRDGSASASLPMPAERRRRNVVRHGS